MAIVVGNVIGGGIFAKPSVIAQDVGNFQMILAGWVIGGVICMFGALCFAELSAMLPRAGGLYVFIKESFGKPAAFTFGVSEFLFGRPMSDGALAFFFAHKLGETLRVEWGMWGDSLGSIVAIGLLAWLNIMGVVWGGRVQGLTTLIKAGFLVVIAALPFVVALASPDVVRVSNYTQTIEPNQAWWGAQFAAMMLAVMWAYNGWHDIAPVAEEVRDPQRNIPRSLIGGVAILIVLYVSVNLAYHGVLSMSEVAGAGFDTAELTITRSFAPLGAVWQKLGASAITFVILCSLFGALNSNILLGPRVAFAMARDGMAWGPLAWVHVIHRTPSTAIIVQSSLAAAFVALTASLISLVPALAKHDVFGLLTDCVTYTANISYTLCVVGLFVLRWRYPEWDRPYRTWGYPVVPVLFLVGQVGFLILAFSAKPMESMVGLMLGLVGLPAYYCFISRKGSSQ